MDDKVYFVSEVRTARYLIGTAEWPGKYSQKRGRQRALRACEEVPGRALALAGESHEAHHAPPAVLLNDLVHKDGILWYQIRAHFTISVPGKVEWSALSCIHERLPNGVVNRSLLDEICPVVLSEYGSLLPLQDKSADEIRERLAPSELHDVAMRVLRYKEHHRLHSQLGSQPFGVV